MNKFFQITISVLVAILLAAVIYLFVTRPKTGYVEVYKVYGDFELKKEYDAKLTTVQTARKNIIDSLSIKLEALGAQIQSGVFNKTEREIKIQEYQLKRQELALKQKSFEEDNSRTVQQYQEQIWKQLNEYMKSYGKEHSYTYIFGADGSGSLMYSVEENNITEEITKYVNERYKHGG